MTNKLELMRVLCNSMIDDHQDWERNSLSYRNTKTNFEIVIRFGSSNLKCIHPVICEFNWWQKLKLWNAYTKSHGIVADLKTIQK